jgi:hypothetical protein
MHSLCASHLTPVLPAPLTPQPGVAPQWSWLEIGSMHALSQLTEPAAQPTVHVPAKQDCELPHALVQVPQLAESLEVSTHVPPQSVWPAAQLALLALQTPLSQASPVAHALSQLPQCAGAAARFTHCDPQATLLPVHCCGVEASVPDTSVVGW